MSTTLDLRAFDNEQRRPLRDPDSYTFEPLDQDVADYIRASLCLQRYQRDQAARETPPPSAPEAPR